MALRRSIESLSHCGVFTWFSTGRIIPVIGINEAPTGSVQLWLAISELWLWLPIIPVLGGKPRFFGCFYGVYHMNILYFTTRHVTQQLRYVTVTNFITTPYQHLPFGSLTWLWSITVLKIIDLSLDHGWKASDFPRDPQEFMRDIG